MKIPKRERKIIGHVVVNLVYRPALLETFAVSVSYVVTLDLIYVIGIFCPLCLFTRKTIHGMTGMKHCMYAAMNERAFLRLLFTSPCSYIAQVEFPQGVLKIFSLRSAKS